MQPQTNTHEPMYTCTRADTHDQTSKSTSKSTQLHKATECLETVHKLFVCCRQTTAQSATVFDVVLWLMNPAKKSPLEVKCNGGQVLASEMIFVMVRGCITIRQKQRVRWCKSFLAGCHQSLAGQQVVAEIIPQTILLLTVRDVCNKGQECNKWGRGQGPFQSLAKSLPSLLKTCQMLRDLISVSFMQSATV